MRYVIFPYNMSSQTSKAIQLQINSAGLARCLRVYPDRTYRPNRDDIIINWGNSKKPHWWQDDLQLLNGFDEVRNAVNKLVTFNKLHRFLHVPPFTTNKDVVKQWFAEGVDKVYARQILTGHGGEGIAVLTPNMEIPDAPLYTKKIKADREYRVFVGRTSRATNEGTGIGHRWDYWMISQSRKLRLTKEHLFERNIELDKDVRNLHNGWIYSRMESCPRKVTALAQEVIAIMDLDFGAVDVLYNSKTSETTCLEINTAPGLEGSALAEFVNFLYYRVGLRRKNGPYDLGDILADNAVREEPQDNEDNGTDWLEEDNN